MSILRDSKGRRPPSNIDAIKVYESMAKLPSFRNKYDWNSNIWNEDQIRLLHSKVRLVLQRIALDSVVKTYTNIDFDVKNTIANTIRSIETGHLYYYLVDDPFYFLDTIPPSPPFKFDMITDYVFWNLFVDNIGHEKNFSKIPLDCHIKYLNSNSDGSLRASLDSNLIDLFNNIIKSVNTKDWIQIARRIKCTPYQCYNYYIHNISLIDSGNWTDELDNRLINAMSTSVGKNFWHEIAQQVGENKTNEQCRLRWSRVLSKRNINISEISNKKLQDELKLLVDIYGTGNWTLVSRHLNLTDKQCRAKYFSITTDRLSSPDRMQELIQCIIDSDWQLDEVKKTLGLDMTTCRRRWSRLDPLGYFIYQICSYNMSNGIGDVNVVKRLLEYVKLMKYKKILLDRIVMLESKKLPIQRIYRTIDWDIISNGLQILYSILGDSVLKLQVIVEKNFKRSFIDFIRMDRLPENWLDVIGKMLEVLWPIPYIKIISITNKYNKINLKI